MVLARAIRRLVALPFLWLGQLAGTLKTPLCIPALNAAWSISGDGDVARIALYRMHQHRGSEAARRQAAAWMAERPRPAIAAFAGLMALEAGETDVARDLLAQGRMLGDDDAGGLDLLDFWVTARSEDPHAAAEFASRMQTRRDLPSALKKLMLTELLWDAMRHQRFEEARDRADFLLQVEDVPEAEMALWALAKHGGSRVEAQRHLRQASLPPQRKIYFQVIGNLAIGSGGEAREMLERLRELDPSLAEDVARSFDVGDPV